MTGVSSNGDTNYRICIAPMMDRTDRHFRYFMRLISSQARLYTEMVTTGAILNGDLNLLLGFDPAEHPLAVQLGGSEPQALQQCSKTCEEFGYDEINLNVGCPSDRVQSGRFGACLMNEPNLVAECVAAMQSGTNLPVTIKCRTGVDENDSYDHLCQFIETIHNVGCDVFIIHARKAWLSGLSPKQNREIPPLDYNRVHQIKKDFPQLTIVINGGFTTPEEIIDQLPHVDGVMIGRAAYANPWLLTRLNRPSPNNVDDRLDVLIALRPYIIDQLNNGTRLSHITRHLLGLYQQQPGGRRFRRFLSENAYKKGAGIEVIDAAIEFMQTTVV